MLPPIDYLVVGHLTCDRLPDGRQVVGGTAAYAALTAAALGRRVGVLTSTGPDWPPEAWAPPTASLSWHRVPAPVTTTFENRYQAGQRYQYLHAVAAPLLPEAWPPAWRAASLIHLGPVAGECDPTWAEAVAGGAFLGLTPQGWLRRVAADGRVYPAVWESAAQLLPLASAVVLSLEDLAGDWALVTSWARQTPLLVVTQGHEGCTWFWGGQAHRFPAPVVEEVDPTGAGDIFAAALFCALAEGRAPAAAIRLATCLAARSVTRPGLAGAPTAADCLACQREQE